jgi:hypothetical protein
LSIKIGSQSIEFDSLSIKISSQSIEFDSLSIEIYFRRNDGVNPRLISLYARTICYRANNFINKSWQRIIFFNTAYEYIKLFIIFAFDFIEKVEF